MYYLYKKSKSTVLPEFHYTFKKFSDFYEISKVLTVPLSGAYYVKVICSDYQELIKFINSSDLYPNMIVYVEVNEALLKYVTLQKPSITLLESKSNFEVFKDLVLKYKVLFKEECLRKMYYAIGHSYEEMDEALELLVTTFPNVRPITEKELSQLFILERVTYPRDVCVAYLRMDRWRTATLNRCLEYFGNDMTLYSMRKNARTFLKEKTTYLKIGQGSKLITMLDLDNIIKLLIALDYKRGRFMDVRTLLSLYEKGENIYDTLQERTLSLTDEKYYALR